ncbi:hypothetical protein NB717_000827 [Xanthomonas sacchari]|nr:hypothetical protein [Xanthomonas sacchari]MCW0392471.1 hypothetical protein [Xanthomonas sacchari]MCW0441543.1 hypothetical protein [Xanthomonas sacchari]MCW0459759.1 hypothetical protein [Xanthomonas sacchari]MCW0464721.1 hypothetical protein [Xanthomonas sacchari]
MQHPRITRITTVYISSHGISHGIHSALQLL